MLDFRPKKRSRNYLGQSEQRRMLLLVMLLGGTLLLFFKTADPNLWRWIAGDVGGNGSGAKVPDTRLSVDRPTEQGTFRAPREIEQSDDPAPAADLFPGVRAEYLNGVKDDTVFRGSETDAWFHLLDVLRKTEQAELRRASTGRVQFAQLYDQPKTYRGRLVSVQGTVRRVVPLEAPKNDYGIKDYYQLWLEPAGGPPLPIVIYALELPKKFPQGVDIEPEKAHVDVTGFSFKRWAYKAQDTTRTAPLILARTVDWKPPIPAARPAESDPRQMWPFVVGAGVVALIAVALIFRRGARSVAIDSEEQPTAGTWSMLRDQDSPTDVDDNLRKLAEQDSHKAGGTAWRNS